MTDVLKHFYMLCRVVNCLLVFFISGFATNTNSSLFVLHARAFVMCLRGVEEERQQGLRAGSEPARLLLRGLQGPRQGRLGPAL